MADRVDPAHRTGRFVAMIKGNGIMLKIWRHRSRLQLGLLGLLSLSLAGCANGSAGGGICGGGKYWQSDGIRTVSEAALAGAVIGGLAGGLGSKGNAGMTVLAAGGGALIGAGIGCAINATKAAF